MKKAEALTSSSNIEEKHGLDESNFDLSVSLSDDFYQFANGGWLKKNPLPDDFSRFGVFDKVYERSVEQIKELIDTLSENPSSQIKDTDAQKIKDIYALGMDTERLNREGALPIMPFVERINNDNLSNIEILTAWMHTGITSTLFSTGVGADQRDSDKHIMYIGYPGLGLGDRDYYLENTPQNEKFMRAYEVYVKKLMQLIGYDKAACQRVWDNVIKIETGFAEHKRSKEELRNPNINFNIIKYDEFKQRYSNFNWDAYFKEFGIEGLTEVNVVDPSFLDYINGLLPTLTAQQIRDLYVFDAVTDSTNFLSKEFEDADFELYGKVMTGTEERKPRWKRVMGVPNSMFGEIVGKLYVEKFFPEENKQYMVELVEYLRLSLGEHIKDLSWMSEPTKKKALEKLSTLSVKIGYPDKWKDYSNIHIDPEKSFLDNIYNASVWLTHYNYSKLNQKVDKSEWLMTPQSVNAYYSPTTNEICFPAGILQPPFFDLSADDALNYGRIGVVIGHEMTHGYDDRGRHFDMAGNLNDWWVEEDSEKFDSLANTIADQFDKIEVAPGVFANGKYTLGENIADQGGLRVAFTAYSHYVKDKDEKIINGYTPYQRFFLAYANVWAENNRPESIAVRVKSDPHSLGKLRVNDTLKNLESFFNAFGIKEGDKMFRPESERTVIW